MKQVLKTIDKNLTAFLVLIPIINVLSILTLLPIHWITGKFGYLISSFCVLLGLTILLSLIAFNRQAKFSSRLLLNILVSLALGYLIFIDLDFLIQTVTNNGIIPCHLGPSCP
jgi:hypothetical protein